MWDVETFDTIRPLVYNAHKLVHGCREVLAYDSSLVTRLRNEPSSIPFRTADFERGRGSGISDFRDFHWLLGGIGSWQATYAWPGEDPVPLATIQFPYGQGLHIYMQVQAMNDVIIVSSSWVSCMQHPLSIIY